MNLARNGVIGRPRGRLGGVKIASSSLSARGGALHVRDRCHQLERLSPKRHGVEKAHQVIPSEC